MVKHCLKCHKPNYNGAERCISCGAKFEKDYSIWYIVAIGAIGAIFFILWYANNSRSSLSGGEGLCSNVPSEDYADCIEANSPKSGCEEDAAIGVPAEYSRCGGSSSKAATPATKGKSISTAAPSSGCSGGCIEYKSGCNIKGNISVGSGDKIYHIPGGFYYDATVIDPKYGERWFCTEKEAQSAGWKKSGK